MKSCNGVCDQGRKECPTPLSCELPEEDEIYSKNLNYIFVPIYLVSITGCVFFIWQLLK